MAECELRQRKKEEDGEDNCPVLQTDNEEMKSHGQDHVQTDNKPEPVRFITNFIQNHFYSVFNLLESFNFLYYVYLLPIRICQIFQCNILDSVCVYQCH